VDALGGKLIELHVLEQMHAMHNQRHLMDRP
jgi:hypothetical protein